MNKLKWEISPAALLLYALVWFFDTGGLVAAAVPAVLAHELGHALFLRLAGCKLRQVSLGLFGLEMDYTGLLGGVRGAMAILAGPLFGLAYALLLALFPGEYCRLSSAVSLALSVFNLLPILPLDGGRLLCLAAGERGERLSLLASLALAVMCISLCLPRGYFSLLALSLWLLISNLKPSP